MGNISDLSSELDKFHEEEYELFNEEDNRLLQDDFTVETLGEILEGLNEDQIKMVKGILEYLTTNKENKPYFLVQGGGGTGKSYSVFRAISHINTEHFVAAAPSHFAKNVLKEFLGEKYKVTTVASLLGKLLYYDDEGKQVLKNNPLYFTSRGLKPPIETFKVILIDEVSMLDDNISLEILNRTKNKKLILLGDYCQLPPVNQEKDSLFFENISVELTKPMRFTGHIYKLTDLIRQQIILYRKGLIPNVNVINTETNRKSEIDMETGSGYVFINSFKALTSLAVKKFKESEDINYCRVLAYRNKTIDKLNYHIRRQLYGEDLDQFVEGELVINTGGYKVYINNNKQKKAIINNGQILRVSSFKKVNGPYNIPCLSLQFKEKTFPAPVLVVSEEGKDIYNKTVKKLKKFAKNNENPIGRKQAWEAYFSFIESFAHFKYSYAISVHKAQGSSIKHSFVLENDILDVKPISVKEKLQSLYVAISRASYRVYIYNPKFKVNNESVTKYVEKHGKKQT